MSLAQVALEREATGIGVIQSPDDFGALAQPDCAGLVLERPTPPAFQAWIDDLDPVYLPSARLVLQPQNVRAALSDLCDAAGMENGHNRQHLINDITVLTHQFRELMAAPYVRLRLDRITTNACRRFHVDAITARLICTYRGTGTQYGNATGEAHPEQIFTVPTGHPILLRGGLWPEQPSANLLHRSPPIEGTGETRLVLVLDPIFGVSDEM